MDATAATQPVPAQSRGILGTVKFVTTLSVIAGLLTTNVASLTNDAAHTSLYDGLQQILGYTLLESFANHLLSHSPTAVRQGDAVKATAKLTAEMQQLGNTVDLERKNHKIEIDELDQHNRKIVAERDDWKTKHQKLTADHTDLNDKHSKLTSDHDELNKRHSKLTADHQQLSNKNQFRQDKVRAISGRMAPRIGGVATKSLATLPGRALPYIGVAASVAFTTWEIAELCNLMNDLDELNISFGNAFNDPNKVCGLPRPSIADFHF
jgi:FtsZ-binding cell division protein ZapB